MADSRLQSLLEEAWTGGSRGHMSAVAEARVWAVREVWREQHQGKGDYGLLSFVAARVKKVGGGRHLQCHKSLKKLNLVTIVSLLIGVMSSGSI